MQTETSRVTQRGGYNREVEWYLTEVSRLHGERSNFAGLVAAIERGGSGGCSGTKGCGIVRIEPFENAGELVDIHRNFRRANACQTTWLRLSLETRWVLAARYCYTREKLPPGLHGQLGDLSAVAVVMAALRDATGEHEASQFDRLMAASQKKSGNQWAEKMAETGLKQAHEMWAVTRSMLDTMEACR